MAAAAPDHQHNKPRLTLVSALSPRPRRLSHPLETLPTTLPEPLGYVWKQEAGIPTLIRPRTISAERTATIET